MDVAGHAALHPAARLHAQPRVTLPEHRRRSPARRHILHLHPRRATVCRQASFLFLAADAVQVADGRIPDVAAVALLPPAGTRDRLCHGPLGRTRSRRTPALHRTMDDAHLRPVPGPDALPAHGHAHVHVHRAVAPHILPPLERTQRPSRKRPVAVSLLCVHGAFQQRTGGHPRAAARHDRVPHRET